MWGECVPYLINSTNFLKFASNPLERHVDLIALSLVEVESMIVQPSNRLMVVVSCRSLKLGNSLVNR